jgi:hypothetical protein
MEITFDFIWIPQALGGHNTGPYEGMRTTIRWQKYLNEFLSCARDVQWGAIDFNSTNNQGSATCSFTADDPLPDSWLQEGELIEFLSGFRVLSVGRITKTRNLN